MKWGNDEKKSITTILKSSHKRTIGPKKSRPRYISALKKDPPDKSRPKKSPLLNS